MPSSTTLPVRLRSYWPEERLWRVEEVSQLCECSVDTIYAALKSGELVGVKRRLLRGRPGNGRPMRQRVWWQITGASVAAWNAARVERQGRVPWYRSNDRAAVRTYWQEAQARSRARLVAGTRPGRGNVAPGGALWGSRALGPAGAGGDGPGAPSSGSSTDGDGPAGAGS